MYILLKTNFILVLGLLFLSTLRAEEKFFGQLDQKKWEIAFQNFSDDESIIELVPEEENLLNWTEMFTIQIFKNLNASASEFVNSLQQAAQDNSEKEQRIRYKSVEPDPINIMELSFIAQTSPQTKIAQNEYNLGRAIKGQQDLYYIRYSAREKETFEKSKPDWIQRLKNAYLAESPLPYDNKLGRWYVFGDQDVYENNKKLTYTPEISDVVIEEAGFSISLPSNWLASDDWLKEASKSEQYPYTIALIFIRPDRAIYGGVAFHDSEAKAPIELNDALKNYLESAEKEDPTIKVIGKGKIQTRLGDIGRYLIIKQGEEISWIAFFEKNQRFFRLEVWAAKNQFDPLKDDIEQIIMSFHLLDMPKSSK